MAGPWEKYQPGSYPPGPGGQSLRQGSTPLGFSNRAIADVLGGPVDLMDWALKPLGLDSDTPLGGSKSMREGMGFIGADVAPEGAQATTYAQRGMGTLGSGAAMLLPGGAAVGALRSAANPVVRGVAAELAAPALRNAPGFMATEALAGFGAGVGGLAGEKEAQRLGIDSAYGRVPGEFIGGLAGVGAPTVAREAFRYTPAGVATEGVMKALLPFTKAGAASRVKGRVGNLVADPGSIPGRIDEPTIANLTPAQRADEAGLNALNQRMRETDPTMEADFVARNIESRKVLEDDLKGLAKGGRTADAVEFLERQRAATEAELLGTLARAREAARSKIEALAPDQKATESSRIQVEALVAARKVSRAEKDRLYNLVDESETISMGDVHAIYQKYLGELEDPTLGNMPGPARTYLDPDSSNTVYKPHETVGRIKALRIALLDVAREDKGEGNRARIANGIAEALRNALEDPADASVNVSKALRNARLYSAEYYRIFEQGNVGRILARSRKGGPAIPPEQALGATLGKSAEAGDVAARQLMEASGASPEALAAQHQYLRKRFTDSTNRGKFLEKNSEMLDRFPELRTQMSEAVESGRWADDVDLTVTAGMKKAPGATERFADAPIYREFDTVVGEKIKNPEAAARALVRKAARDPSGEATLGVKAAALDYLIRDARKGGKLSGESIRAALTDERIGPALRAVLGRDDMRRLARIANELDLIARSEAPNVNVGGVMEDQVNSIIGFIGTTLGARGGAKMGGGVSGASLKTASAASSRIQKMLQGLTNNESERLMRDAAMDNDLYKMLFTPWTSPARIKQVEGRLVEYLAAESGAAVEGMRGREPLPPSGPWSKFSPQTDAPRSEISTSGPVGLADMAPDVKTRFVNLQRKFKARLIVNSGVRTQAENDAIEEAAPKSRHLEEYGGDALDIDTSGMSIPKRQKLFEEASRAGYTGISFYPTHMHVDTGKRRTWGETPKWATAIMRSHMAGRFTKETKNGR